MAPISYHTFAQLDFCLIQREWQHSVLDVFSDRFEAISSHHFLVVADFVIDVPKTERRESKSSRDIAARFQAAPDLWDSSVQEASISYMATSRRLVSSDEEIDAARKELRDSLVAISPIFQEKPYFMSEEFSLVDCVIAPILWRLPALGIELPEAQCKPLIAYMDRLFDRESFQESLSEAEREIRE